jgi:hypothetical protein
VYWNNFCSISDFQEKDMTQYWYNYLKPNYEFSLFAIETDHCIFTVTAKDPSVPRDFAMKDPDWAAAIAKEQTELEANSSLAEVPDTGQHLMMSLQHQNR